MMLETLSKTVEIRTICSFSITTLIFLFLCNNSLFAEQNTANPQLAIDPATINLPKELIPKDKGLLKRFSKRKYFPPNVFSQSSKANDIQTNWLSLQLVSMEEMPFWNSNLNKSPKILNKYRFLYIPTFETPTLIRIDIFQDGRGILTVKQTDKPGGFEIGKLKLNKTIKLSKEKVQEFLVKIAEVKFWSMELYVNYSSVDGTNWVLEGVEKHQYHIVTRISPRKGKFSDLGLLLFKLAGMHMPEV